MSTIKYKLSEQDVIQLIARGIQEGFKIGNSQDDLEDEDIDDVIDQVVFCEFKDFLLTKQVN